MGGQKPHLLIGTCNNMGAETKVAYVPSTKFYLADKAAGRLWATKLPFSVQVIERVESIDYVSRQRYVQHYALPSESANTLGDMVAKLIWTALFVFLNGIFVAAEFALVKTRPARMQALADQGDARAKRLIGMFDELDLYLSACQLGITIASLVLGYLAEPAFAALIELAAESMGFDTHDNTTLHVVSFGLALTIVTLLHMVLGEQWPKIWAIHTAERTSLRLSLPLKIFTMMFKPLIVVANVLSNGLLPVRLRVVRVVGRRGRARARAVDHGLSLAAGVVGDVSHDRLGRGAAAVLDLDGLQRAALVVAVDDLDVVGRDRRETE
ncbi:CNNM domain-containing protein [Enhygromyxa salina]|uniref:CNNM transmembrane domain-containing protein n=1 Tax=Enhygromyxa salina TaxID=215803 RepID=A0A2S9YP36_9BACT|nr:CNNM domain-containing protein [Enhygromyxa salina]PRQ06850.1 hypothetical protein ENSA7_33880 [Enhygromyxa salina]